MSQTQERHQESEGRVIYGAPEGQDARILAERARDLMAQDRVLVHIALDDTRIATLKELMAFFAPDVQIVEFPAWDCLPYDRVTECGHCCEARGGAEPVVTLGAGKTALPPPCPDHYQCGQPESHAEIGAGAYQFEH